MELPSSLVAFLVNISTVSSTPPPVLASPRPNAPYQSLTNLLPPVPHTVPRLQESAQHRRQAARPSHQSGTIEAGRDLDPSDAGDQHGCIFPSARDRQELCLGSTLHDLRRG